MNPTESNCWWLTGAPTLFMVLIIYGELAQWIGHLTNQANSSSTTRSFRRPSCRAYKIFQVRVLGSPLEVMLKIWGNDAGWSGTFCGRKQISQPPYSISSEIILSGLHD